MFKLDCNVILITGATSGLGRKLAVELAATGKSIIAVGRDPDKLKSLLIASSNIRTFLCDFESDISKKDLYNELKVLDIDAVIHCLGGGFKLSQDLLSSSGFMRLFNLNFLVSAEINEILIPRMLKNKRGWIVHIGSIASREVTASVGYTSIKAIIPAYVKTLGRRLIANNVYMSAIIPGGMVGERGAMDRLELINSSAVSSFITKKRPTGKLSKVEDYLRWVEMLLSAHASLHASNSIILDEGESTSI